MSLEILIRVTKNREFLIFIVVTILGISIGAFLYHSQNYSLIFYGDSVSHLVGARKIVDSTSPGIDQIGTVWLPLPHILFLPFSLNTFLFTSGAAGLVVNLACTFIGSIFLYRIIKTTLNLSEGRSSYLPITCSLLYAVNPNVLYLSLTAMTEAPFMLFFIASCYYFQRFLSNPVSLKNVAYSSVFVMLATLCRYEGWLLPNIFNKVATAAVSLEHRKI